MADPAIAFDITPLQNAHRFRGIGTYVRGLASRLAAQNDVPIEFWGWDGAENVISVAPPHRVLAIPRQRMPEYRGAWLFAQLAMRRRARISSARAIHVTDPNAMRAISGRKMMTTVYDLIPFKQGIRRRSILNRLGYSTYLHALRRADVLFAISGQTARDMVRILEVPRERIVIARPGIELPQSRPNPSSAGRPYFLFLGGPNPNKNLAAVIDAMALAQDVREEVVVAGHWLPQQVSVLNSELDARHLKDRIRYIGFVPDEDLVPLMRGATALVVPSLDEGFGLPVGEGLAAGAAVIHSDIPILDEISAGTALTFDPRSPEQLAQCLRRAASDPALIEDLRKRGMQRAKELTWDSAVKATLETYAGVDAR